MCPAPTGKLNIARRRKARKLLLQATYQWQMSGADATEIEAQFRADNGAKVDWDFFHSALQFVSGRYRELDELFKPFLDRRLEELNPVELALLRMGAFELSQRVDVPYRVVINECVELAKTYGATDGHKYINGVLDKTAHRLRSPEINANN